MRIGIGAIPPGYYVQLGRGEFLPAGAGQRMASSLLLLNPTNANKHFKAQDAKSVQSKDV